MKKSVVSFATAAFLTTALSTTVSAHTYVVKKGDTLYDIAKKYKTTVKDLKSLNQLNSDLIFVNQTLKIAAPASTPATQEQQVKTYTVVPGDTLIKIANQHNISLAELKQWNNITSHLIYPGNVFVVSPPASTPAPENPGQSDPPVSTTAPAEDAKGETVYVIKSGDTLSEIAYAHQMTVAQLKSLNQITSDLIFPGQKLKLQVGAPDSGQGTSGGQAPVNPVQPPAAPSGNEQTAQLIDIAKQLIGIPYAWGGTSVSGFDCSGFIFYVFKNSGRSLNRLSAAGYYSRSYYVNDPKPGDLVFFENTYKAGISHLGIYLGNNEFIHADSSGVRITSLDNPYYNPRFDGFKRFY
ncbi:LysM peptidoglycan-binding domain-containing protein [Bacillaceae bacterium Marseille-Q3522]|nr:LysM peptidoglycan-binding domain-containing protein [Bacillaceae bacterium Marseille-Q3522]